MSWRAQRGAVCAGSPWHKSPRPDSRGRLPYVVWGLARVASLPLQRQSMNPDDLYSMFLASDRRRETGDCS
jgi:hypothetical protein